MSSESEIKKIERRNTYPIAVEKTTLKTGGEDCKTTLVPSGKIVENTLETGVKNVENTLETGVEDVGNTLETSVEDLQQNEIAVNRKIKVPDPPRLNYTQNEWRRFKNTLETSGEDLKIHSKRVEKI